MIRAAIAATAIAVCGFVTPAQAAFPGQNGRIAFSSDRADPLFDIYSVAPDGTDVRRLTTDAQNNLYAAWSPDGRKLAFSGGGPDGFGSFIWVMNADGTGKTNLPSSSGAAAFDPAWSPDGSKLVFESPSGTLRTMNADGSGEAPLVRGFSPAWSPDGSKIAFARDVGDSGGYDVYTVSPDGTGQTRLTDNPAFDGWPNWSPDGTKIAWTTTRDQASPFDSEIYVMNADGSDETNLTRDPRFDDEAAWSPDGTKIAWMRIAFEGPEIFVMNADGSGQTRLMTNDHFDFKPDWQPVVNEAPDCSSVTAAPSSLAPADRTLRLVSLAGATDPDGDAVTLAVSSATQDEPLTGAEDKTSPDAFSKQLTPDPDVAAILDNEPDEIYLRAERRNSGDGRVYRLGFSGSDGHGGTCSGTTTVSVPRHGTAAFDSSPPSYNSLGS